MTEKQKSDMAAKVAKGALRKSKPVVSKTILNSPYEKIWTTVVGDDMHFILQTLLDKFNQIGLKKVEAQTKFSRGKKSKKAKVSEENNNNSVEDKKVLDPETPKKEVPPQGWTCVDLRKQLAIGINEVTRALEKNDLYLVIVCKSAKPEMITKHIIELSYSRAVPACQLPRLSENMAPALGLNSVLALGFRKSSDVFQQQVKAILPLVPPLRVPWLPICYRTNEVDELEVEDSGNTTTSKKRKLSPTVQPADVTLQDLKVKKIVPNPNKKRKVKVKKAKKVTPTHKKLK